jgi:hypothetical protein
MVDFKVYRAAGLKVLRELITALTASVVFCDTLSVVRFCNTGYTECGEVLQHWIH